MNLLLLVFLISFVIVISIAVIGLRQPVGSPARTIATIGVCFVLVGIAICGAIGFIASGDAEPSHRLLWRWSYASLTIGSLIGAVWIGRRGRMKS